MIQPLINRRYLLGHPVIDSELEQIGNYWLRTVSCGNLEFPLHLARLKRAMSRHFEHEAELMAQVGRGLCAHHRADHGSLLEVCSEAASLFDQNWRKSRSLIRTTLAKMVRAHIIHSDQCAVLTMYASRNSEMATH